MEDKEMKKYSLEIEINDYKEIRELRKIKKQLGTSWLTIIETGINELNKNDEGGIIYE